MAEAGGGDSTWDCISTSMLAKVGNADNLADNLTGFEDLRVDDQHKVLLRFLLPVPGAIAQPLHAAGTAEAAAGAGMAAVPGPKEVKPKQQALIRPAVPLGADKQREAQFEAPNDPRLSKVANPSLQKDPNAVYIVEYAVSGRAKCSKCRELIPQRSLREGVSFEAAFGMGTTWKHWDCVSDVVLRNIGCVGNLKGWDELEPTDLQRVETSFLDPPKLRRISHKKKQAVTDTAEKQAASTNPSKPADPGAAVGAGAPAAGSSGQPQGEQDLAGFLQATMAGGYPPAAALAMALSKGGQLGRQAAQLLTAGTLATDPAALIAQAAAFSRTPAMHAAPAAAAATPAQVAEAGPVEQAPQGASTKGSGKSRSKKAAGGAAAKKAKPAKRQRRRKEASDDDDEEEYEDQNVPSPGNESDEEWRPGKRSGGKKRGRSTRR
ncbi:hypothetical protein N2152v2_009564 [Parachlorella kessleri]